MDAAITMEPIPNLLVVSEGQLCRVNLSTREPMPSCATAGAVPHDFREFSVPRSRATVRRFREQPSATAISERPYFLPPPRRPLVPSPYFSILRSFMLYTSPADKTKYGFSHG